METNTPSDAHTPHHLNDMADKDDFPSEVAEMWDAIRAGARVLVDEHGQIVSTLQDASALLHPHITSEPVQGLPAVGVTPVGKPDTVHLGDLWIDPDSGSTHVYYGDSMGVVKFNQSG